MILKSVRYRITGWSKVLKLPVAWSCRGDFSHELYSKFSSEILPEWMGGKNAEYWAGKAAAYPHLNIYMENMFDTDFRLLAELGEQLQSVSNFGICFDYAHAHAFGEVWQIEEWVRALAPFIRHIHINDNDFMSDSHLALGDGKIDWNKFKKYYEEYFSKASVLIEVTGSEKIKSSLEYLKRL